MNHSNHILSCKTLQHEKSREQEKDWRADQPCDEKWSLGVRMSPAVGRADAHKLVLALNALLPLSWIYLFVRSFGISRLESNC